MKKNGMNRMLALALAVMMVVMLAACSASSSSTTTTTVSTSVTDENGNTTTNTTTTEVGSSVGTDGVSTTNTTTTETTTTGSDDAAAAEEQTPEEEAAELTDRMYNLYTGGAKGTNADGDTFYFAYNEGNDNLMLAIKTADDSQFNKWHGYLGELDDGQPVITGYSDDKYIPYEIQQNEGEDTFTLSFPENGDVANMEVMDFDEFVEDLVNEWVNF